MPYFLWQISEKQYILTALGARAKLRLWFDVDSLFNTKNWLGYTKKKSPIGFHKVVDILHKNNAPISVPPFLYWASAQLSLCPSPSHGAMWHINKQWESHYESVLLDVQVLQEYVNLIDDTEVKLSMALKYKCHDIVINVSFSFSSSFAALWYLNVTYYAFYPSDVQGPEGPTAACCVRPKAGARLCWVQEGPRNPQQWGKRKRTASSELFSSSLIQNRARLSHDSVSERFLDDRRRNYSNMIDQYLIIGVISLLMMPDKVLCQIRVSLFLYKN